MTATKRNQYDYKYRPDKVAEKIIHSCIHTPDTLLDTELKELELALKYTNANIKLLKHKVVTSLNKEYIERGEKTIKELEEKKKEIESEITRIAGRCYD
jgi:hypothetical protein